MAKLLNDKAMATIQKLVAAGMQTSIDIYPQALVETASDTQVAWPTLSATVLGWVRTIPATSLGIDVGVLQADAVFRLLLPIDTVIHPGDQVEIAGERYNVIDTNAESTYQTSLRCTIRKLGT